VDTPFEQRSGEFNIADGPATIDNERDLPASRQTDWGANDSARYFGEPAIAWQELSGFTLKTVVLRASRRKPLSAGC